MVACDEIISVMDIVPTKKKNTMGTNVLKNCHSKKVRDHITIDNYYYLLSLRKK